MVTYMGATTMLMAASSGEAYLARVVAAVHWLVQHGGRARWERPDSSSARRGSSKNALPGVKGSDLKPL